MCSRGPRGSRHVLMIIAECHVIIAECHAIIAECHVIIAECRVIIAECHVIIAESRSSILAVITLHTSLLRKEANIVDTT